MTWRKKWILPCLLAVFLTGCQGGKQEIPYISDGSVSWDAVEKAEIYGGGCAVPALTPGSRTKRNGSAEFAGVICRKTAFPFGEWTSATA